MSGLVMMVGGAIVNALAFSGSNYMFSKLRSDEERERHNKAMEDLAKAQDVYQKRRIAHLDFINKKLREQGHSVHTFTNVDDAMNEYYLVTGKKFLTSPPPDLSDFYKPSEDQKAAEIAFIVVGMSSVYLLAHFLV